MSLRIKKYRLTCTKIGCTFAKTLPLYNSKDNYLLSDGTKFSVNYFRVDGWCKKCNDYCQIFAPKDLAKIKSEIYDIENRFNNSGFLGFNKKRSPEDIELFNLNKKIIDILRRRKIVTNMCTSCNGTDITFFDFESFISSKIPHQNCSGHFQLEEGFLIIGSNLCYATTSFKNINESEFRDEYTNWMLQKGKLLDPNDRVLS